MFKIPQKLDIGGQTFQIKQMTGLSRGGAHGMCRYDDGEIWLDADLKPNDLKGITFYHELVHAIMNTMGRQSLRDDEGFVDSFANLLWQAEKTRKY